MKKKEIPYTSRITEIYTMYGAKEVVLIEFIKVDCLEKFDIEQLITESTHQGYRFVKRLKDEYEQGINRFDLSGESLFVVISETKVIGIGGLNHDPYLNREGYGRVRHVYVLKSYRGRGIGKAILKTIIDEAKHHFRVLTLNTNNEVADVMYCKEGFIKSDQYEYATHYLRLGD